jgi:hypothetical protein
LPFIPVIAACASSSTGIVTNPNPFDSPLAASFTIRTDSTAPKAANASFSFSSVVWRDKFPT